MTTNKQLQTHLLGPYAQPRQWLLNYMKTARFANAVMEDALKADWTTLNREHAAYLCGAVWGRLRQMDNSLETKSEYGQLVIDEFTHARDIQGN